MQVSTAPAVPVPGVIASVTVVVLPAPLVTVWPAASWTVTTGWVVKATPAVPPLGWVVKASFVAGPAEIVNVALSSLPPPLHVAVRT